MLDEGLQVVTRLWTGDSVDFEGKHYRIQSTGFKPTPIQRPRIPVWVGGFWPNRKPMRRAAEWDGVIPLFDVPEGQSDLGELADCVEYTKQYRRTDQPFDVIYVGITPGDNLTKAADLVRQYRQVGVTWWLESIAPYRFGESFAEPWDLQRLRQRVLQGPPRS
jgi:alkanesulfonate monooxygenase SsuD/methylene tetrahydromethanopterin reductase-like flavin-dependent oxidoreductase (luciferase family)